MIRLRRQLKGLGSAGAAKLLLSGIDKEAIEVVGAAAEEAKVHVKRGMLPNIGAHGAGRGSDLPRKGVREHNECIEKTYRAIQKKGTWVWRGPKMEEGSCQEECPCELSTTNAL